MQTDASIAEVAQSTAMSERAIRAQCARGHYPNAYKAGGEWRVPLSDLPPRVQNIIRSARTGGGRDA